jgi:hypothetical protein
MIAARALNLMLAIPELPQLQEPQMSDLSCG